MSMRRYSHRAPVATLMVAFVTIAAIVLGLTLAAGANAGTYVIDNCPAAPTSNGNAGPWVVFGSPQNAKGSCGGGAGDYLAPRGGSMGPNTSDGVQVAVPAGSAITIREAKVWWAVPKQESGAETYAVAGGVRTHDALDRDDRPRTLPAPGSHPARRSPGRQALEGLRPGRGEPEGAVCLQLSLPRHLRTHDLHVPSGAPGHRGAGLSLRPRVEPQGQGAGRSVRARRSLQETPYPRANETLSAGAMRRRCSSSTCARRA